MVTNNYQIAARHYSYSVLRNQLTATIKMFFGDSAKTLTAEAHDSRNEDYLYIDPQAVLYKRYDRRSCQVRN
jgi:hypothetical protein